MAIHEHLGAGQRSEALVNRTLHLQDLVLALIPASE